jgi:hypothetical protein
MQRGECSVLMPLASLEFVRPLTKVQLQFRSPFPIMASDFPARCGGHPAAASKEYLYGGQH